MLMGILVPTAGRAVIRGLDCRTAATEVKRHVGYLPDSVGFYGRLTGRENLRYTARLNGIPPADAEVAITELLAQVGLDEAADRPADTYSRGMLQRLGIADALVKNPAVLILDEPTTAIDPTGVADLLALIRSLVADRGIGVLLSSHLLEQVERLCDRIGIFSRGRRVAVGTVAELSRRAGGEALHLDEVYRRLVSSKEAEVTHGAA
jgi:ABC-2 type transport system ATP-binding protein